MNNIITGRSEKILMKIFKGWKNEDDINNEMFMVRDLFGVLTAMGRTDATVIVILNYNGTQEEKAEALKDIISLFDSKDDVVILTWAYVSTKEFTELEYYNQYNKNEDYIKESKEANKKPIPYNEIIERESKLLESVGFIDFNFYVNYEFSNAYLYGNSLGKEVINTAKNL